MNDLLSSCPSLVDILAFISHEDIKNCKLVNRRLYSVIGANARSMQRKWLDFYINSYFYWNSDNQMVLKFIRFTVTGFATPFYAHHVFLNEDRVWMYSHSASVMPFLFDYFESNDDIFSNEPFVPCEGHPHPLEGLYDRLDTLTSYRVKSYEEGLQTILSLIFGQFYFNDIIIRTHGIIEGNTFTFPEGHLAIIAKEFKFSRSVCRNVEVIGMWRDMERLDSVFGCKNLRVCPIYFTINECLPMITKWDLNLEFSMSPYQLHRFEPIVTLLKKWKSGDLELRRLNLRSNLFVGEDPFLPNTFLSSFDCFNRYGPVYFRDESLRKCVGIVITRDTDSSSLFLTYCDQRRLNITYSAAMNENEKCILDQHFKNLLC